MIIQPEVSVIISTYNRHRPSHNCHSLLERALSSILNQSFFDFELILINDASTDGTEAICRKYAKQDQRIKYIHHTQNTQLPARCYNEGIALSRGKFITFMFDDDEWLPNALEDLYLFFTQTLKTESNLGMVYGLADLISVNEEVDNHYLKFGDEWDLKNIMKYNFLANCAVMIRRDVIDCAGAYDESPVLRRICDWDLWQRIARRFHVRRLQKLVALVYHSQPDSIRVKFSINTEDVRYHQLFRYSYPLKTKTMSGRQVLHYLYTFYIIYKPNVKINIKISPVLLHKIKMGIKRFLILIGGWRLAKALYDRLKT